MLDYYKILSVSPGATAQEIQRAYREQIKLHHPDLNQNSEYSQRRTQLIVEAYTVLKDSVKRAEYDNALRLRRSSPMPQDTGEPASRSTQTEPPPSFCCDSCGRRDSTLRVTVFVWVVSAILVSYKNGWGKILCSRCRHKYSVLFNLEVSLLGWWGFPWGIFYSLEALWNNSKGGIQPDDNNFQLLQFLAYDLYRSGDVAESVRALRECSKLRRDSSVERLLSELEGTSKVAQDFDLKERILRGSPVFVNLGLLMLAVVWLIWSASSSVSGPTKYQEQFPGWNPYEEKADSRSAVDDGFAKMGVRIADVDSIYSVSGLQIEKLAEYIGRHVPFVGTTHEATKTINHYELDRSKLVSDSVDFYARRLRSSVDAFIGIANRVVQLEDSSNAIRSAKEYMKPKLQFVTAAYFNAKMLEISIGCVNGMEASGHITATDLQKLDALIKYPMVYAWLTGSQWKGHVLRLREVLDSSIILFQSAEQLEKRLFTLQSKIEVVRDSIEALTSTLNNLDLIGDIEGYNSIVPYFNNMIEIESNGIDAFDALLSEYEVRLANWVDYAEKHNVDSNFNACLDPGILLSEFESVDLVGSSNTSRPTKPIAPSDWLPKR